MSRYEEMLQRKILIPDQFKSAGEALIQSAETQNGGQMVEIVWKDETKSRFHSIWLRHSCHCSSCKADVSSQSIIDISSIPDTAYIQHTDISEEGVLKITWNDGKSDHKGFLPAAYLKHYTYSDGQLEKKLQLTRSTFSTDTVLPEIEYKDVMETQSGLYKWLKLLTDRGVCLINNVPTKDKQVIQVANRVSHVQHTVYGEVFEVRDMPDASNPAYTNIELKLHMDQQTYESPPGIQFLHCLRFDDIVEGGNSTFADMYHIVDVFRQEHPDEFEILCRVPVTFQTIGYGKASGRDVPVHFQIKRPIITSNKAGDVTGINYNGYLLGPLQAHEDDVVPFYTALKMLTLAVHNWPYMYRHRLRPGDMITVQNRRALHGRTAYVSNGGKRHLQGTYLNIDEFRSMLTYLHNTLGDGSPLNRMGLFDM